jgi:hypothetical protein
MNIPKRIHIERVFWSILIITGLVITSCAGPTPSPVPTTTPSVITTETPGGTSVVPSIAPAENTGVPSSPGTVYGGLEREPSAYQTLFCEIRRC